MKKLILSFFALVILNHNASSQCSMVPVTLNSRVNNGSLIVEGTVINKRSFWNAEHNYIYTSNLLEVYKVFKGSTVSYQLEVVTEGGQIDLFKQTVEPSLQLNVGQTGMFVLNPSAQSPQFDRSIYSVYADAQGFIKYDENTGSATDLFNTYPSVENDLYAFVQQAAGTAVIVLQPNIKGSAQKPNSSNSTAAISGISPTTITAGTATSLTITGTGFGATQGTSYVEFPDADAGSGYVQPHATQYLSWSPTQIVVEVPTKTSSGGTLTTSGTAGTGQIRVVVAGTPTLSAQTLTITYGHLNVYYSTGNAIYNTRHVTLNGMGGITWQMYTGFDAMAAPKAAFQRAFQSWRCATLINWALGSTVATNTIAFDGVNVIRFDIGAELPAGVLGRCTSYFSGCITGTVVTFYVSELDICFDSGATWQYGPAAPTGGQYDFESVTLHELGHGHQLSHVISATDVMNYSIANAVSKRVLNVDDIAGGNAVMTRNLSGGVCGKPVMTAISASACAAGTPTPAFTISSTTICAGQSINLTDISGGSPTIWSWTLTGGAPATSTVQNPSSISYAAPGVYSVVFTAGNGFGTSAPITKTISVIAAPTSANAGPNQVLCISSSSATMAGNVAASGVGAWTLVSGSGVITNSLSPTTSITGLAVGTNVFAWTISNGVCAPSVSNVTISVNSLPTAANAGASQTICASSPNTNLAGNIPVTGVGAWSLVSGSGVITNSALATSPVTGLGVGANVFKWTISNAPCAASASNVTITVNPTPVISAIASPTLICSGGQTTTLTASGATSYVWNPGAFAGNNVPTSLTTSTTFTVSGTTAGCTGTNTVLVTVSPCTDIMSTSAGTNSIRVYPNPTQNNLIVSFGASYSGKLVVYNAIGQEMISKNLNEVDSANLDLSTYSKGMYFVHIKPNNGKESIIKVIRD